MLLVVKRVIMPIKISVTGSQAQEDLLSLHEWLLEDPDVHRGAKIELLPGKGKPGDRSATLEIISLITSGAFSGANLTVAIMNWRSNRPNAGKVVLKSGGVTVRARDTSSATVQKLMEALADPKADED